MGYLDLSEHLPVYAEATGRSGDKYANNLVVATATMIEESAGSLSHCLPRAAHILKAGKGSVA